MASRSIPGLVLEEAADVLGDLMDWLRTSPYCPRCLSLQGCSHDAGCALGRVARLHCLLGSGDEKLRDDELVALGRQRGRVVPPADASSPAPTGAVVTGVPGAVHVEPVVATQAEAGAT